MDILTGTILFHTGYAMLGLAMPTMIDNSHNDEIDEEAEEYKIAQNLFRAMGLNKDFKMVWSDTLPTPAAIGSTWLPGRHIIVFPNMIEFKMMPPEIKKCALAHEFSHIKLNHNIWQSLIPAIVGIATAIFLTPIIGPVFALVSSIVTSIIAKIYLTRKAEVEADLMGASYCTNEEIEKLIEFWEDSLKKRKEIDPDFEDLEPYMDIGHPTLAKRIEILRDYLAKRKEDPLLEVVPEPV